MALVSSGTSDHESAFLDASETGGDVFFMTTTKLVSQDFDSNFDVYDALECTASSPCLPSAASAQAPCSNESCKAPFSGQGGESASAAFSGPGNLVQQTAVLGTAKPKPLTRRKS